MNKLLPLLCFTLLPLPVFALVENATVSTEVLPSVSDVQQMAPMGNIESLKVLVEAQLEKIPDLSGIYVGTIRGDMPQAGESNTEPQIEFFRIALLSEGVNRFWVGDEVGAFKIDMTLKPSGRHWSLDGLAEYRTYAEPQKVWSSHTSVTVPEKLMILGGLSSEQVRTIAQSGKNSVAGNSEQAQQGAEQAQRVTEQGQRAAGQEQRIKSIAGIFVLNTDAADPKDSPNNPIHRVELPSGRVVMLKPELSPAEVQATIAKIIAKEKAEAEAAAAKGKPAGAARTGTATGTGIDWGAPQR